MGLVPEFFILLGICIFPALSLLSALLDDDVPSFLQYLFQGGAFAGLGLLFMSRNFINTGTVGRDPTDATRFWLSVVYLTSAVSSVIGLNVYLAARRKIAQASFFSGTVTAPTFVISALFVLSFLGSGGEADFTPATIMMLTIAALVVGLSMFGFLREASKHVSKAPGEQGSSPTGPVSMPPGTLRIDLPLRPPSMGGLEWEEFPKKKEDGE